MGASQSLRSPFYDTETYGPDYGYVQDTLLLHCLSGYRLMTTEAGVLASEGDRMCHSLLRGLDKVYGERRMRSLGFTHTSGPTLDTIIHCVYEMPNHLPMVVHAYSMRVCIYTDYDQRADYLRKSLIDRLCILQDWAILNGYMGLIIALAKYECDCAALGIPSEWAPDV